jgi:iron complex outermembrane receptor protein
MMQHGGKTGQFDYYLTGRYRNSENNRDDADFNAQNYSMRMGYDLDEHFRINFDNLTMSSRFTDPGPITAPRKDNWYKVRIRDGASFDIENNFEKTSGIVKFYGSYGEHLIFDGFNSQDQIVGSYFLQDFKIFEDNTFTVGADVKNYGGEARNQRTNTDYGRHTIQEYAGFLTDEHVLWERLKLFAGLRLQNNSEFGDKLLPQGGISFKVLPELELRSAVSTGYRSPTIAELYFPFPVSAQGLNPETSVNYEFGVRHVPIKKLSYDLVYFYTVIDDTIVTLGQWPNFERTNAGNSTNRGVEVAVDYQAIENRLSFWGNYSYINADELTFATPEHKADIGIHWSYKKLKVSPSAEYVHKLYGADSHNNRLPDFFLLNAKFLYKITKYMDGFMNVDNITDKHYELVTDYPMPGITFFGGISCYF